MARIELLDHGYIELIETWGSDERIVEAARMSTQKGFEGWGPRVMGTPCLPNGEPNGQPRRELPQFLVDVWYAEGKPSKLDATNPWLDVREEPGDEKLLSYLWNNKHGTPFEMAGAIFEIQAPIFVFREWHRHRTQSYNEMSARYAPLPDVNYIPTVERLMFVNYSNKQAGKVKGSEQLTEAAAKNFRAQISDIYARAQWVYEEALSAGVPKELARVHLPVGRYSKMRASAVLRNWLAFLTLRQAPTAQWEIRQYANMVGSCLALAFPRTYELFLSTRGF